MSLRSQRAFLVCLTASLVLHVLVLSELPGIPTLTEERARVLQAELQSVSPPPRTVPVTQPQARPAPRKVAPPAVSPAAPHPQAPAMTSETPMAEPPPAAAEAPTGDASESPVAAGPVPNPADTTSAQDAAPPEPLAATEEPGTPAFPNAGSITYELFYGSDKFSVGRSVQTWSIEHGSYRLTSFSVTTGLVGLFRPYQYAYVSEGRVEADGLRPLTFTMSRGRGGERQAMARFDWNLEQLTYGPLHRPRHVPLAPGTYDFLSFIYQLARTRLAPGRMELTITTATRLDTYVLEVGAEEEIELPLGTVRAIPVRQVAVPGEETVQIWLAAERPQLPLRIRFLDRDGRLKVDQLATKVEIERA